MSSVITAQDSCKSRITYIRLEPRWKWFKPPMWKIFRWAYKIKKVYNFTNAYPLPVMDTGDDALAELESKWDAWINKNKG